MNVLRLCPICDCNTGEVLHNQKFVLPEGHPQTDGYDVVCCQDCGFIYADTPTSQRDYEDYYTKFSRYTNSIESIGGGDLPWDAGRLLHTASDIARIVSDKAARIVDIGCCSGGLLRALKLLGYTNLCGVDLAVSCVQQSTQLPEIEAYVGSLLEIPPEVGQVDCFVLSHVLEHVRDLRPALENLRRFLKPDGYIYVEVPDTKRYPGFMVAPFQEFNTEHLNHFSLVSMANLLNQCGFTPTISDTKMFLLAQNGPQPSLFMFATPSDSTQGVKKDVSLKGYVENYIDISHQMLNEINTRLEKELAQVPTVMVWATGQLALRLVSEGVLADANIVAFVDSNPIYQGMSLRGSPILAPRQIEPSKIPIVIASILHYHDICENINQMGLPNPIISLREMK